MKTIDYVIPVLLVFLLVASCSANKDDTDPTEGRSGLALHTDNLTGCQYLAKPFGGITPRLDAQGKHICKGGGR